MHYKSRKIEYKTILVSNNNARFLNRFLKDEPDYLENILNNYQKMLHDTTREEFRVPYDKYGFYFSYKQHLIKMTKNGTPCLIEDLHETPVIMHLTIKPYDFIIDSKRKVGISIKVSQIIC
jgi:hypothetical protein